MSINVVSLIYRGQLRGLEDAVQTLTEAAGEAGANGQKLALLVPQLRALARWCLEAPAALRSDWQARLEMLATGQAAYHPQAVVGFEALVDLALRVLADWRQLALLFEGSGQPVEGTEEVGKAVTDLRQLKDHARESWPRIDDQLLTRARAEWERGEYPSAGEALEDLLLAQQAARRTPPYATLRELADRFPPPPVWFAETGKPF